MSKDKSVTEACEEITGGGVGAAFGTLAVDRRRRIKLDLRNHVQGNQIAYCTAFEAAMREIKFEEQKIDSGN